MVFGLKGGIIGGSHEAGTGLDDMGKFVMTYDTGIGVLRAMRSLRRANIAAF